MNHPIIRHVTESASHRTNRPPLPLLSNTIGHKDAGEKADGRSRKERTARGKINSSEEMSEVTITAAIGMRGMSCFGCVGDKIR